MQTLVYSYHPVTRRYISSAPADVSPLDDEVLVPADATLDEPPEEGEGLVAAYVDGAWALVQNKLGQSVWLPDGTEIKISSLAQEIPLDALNEEPDLRSLDEVKAAAVSAVASRHAELLRRLTGNASIEERDTWQTKALASEAVLSGAATSVQTEMITTEASIVGEDVSGLAHKIAAKHSAYQRLIGLASGLKRKTENDIEEASNAGAVAQVLAEADVRSEQLTQQWLSDSQLS